MPKTDDYSWLNKHYMERRDFEAEHAIHSQYPKIVPHYHEFYELYFFLTGHADYVVGDVRFQLESGDLLLVPPNIVHNPVFHDFTVCYDRYVVWISSGLMERLFTIDPELRLFQEKNRENRFLYRSGEEGLRRLRPAFGTICSAYEGQQACRRSEGIAAILTLLAEYNRVLSGQNEKLYPASRDTLLTDILCYIRENLTGDLSLDTVAEAFYTNKFHLSHVFKQEMRISFYQYVIQLRLIAGKNHILAGMPVGQVWDACGFSDHAGFYRAFRKMYGVSPSQFKQFHSSLLAGSDADETAQN
ncbi:MAG: helix-turn-helix transcriptional regulator [Clostridiaceae bacterium]|nr:helix-turn-helix transcriptional regulator [Clostridiaceae bacterium]